MKFKKGQVAVFVILGIVIVAGIILLIRPDVLKAGVSSEVEPIYSFVQQCLDETSRQAVIYVSERGGYYNVPEQSFAETTPYYLYEGTNLMPSKGIIAEELSLYVNENIGYCLNDFFSFTSTRHGFSYYFIHHLVHDDIFNQYK